MGKIFQKRGMPLYIPVKTVLGLNEEMKIALKYYSSYVVDT